VGAKTDSKFTATVAPHIFASMPATDWLTFGIAIFPNYGIVLNWPDDWEGNMYVIDNKLESLTFNPNISFGPFSGFSIAVGIDVIWSRFSLSRALPLGYIDQSDDATNTMRLQGDDLGFGGNVGLSYQPVTWVRLGLGYRSGYDMSISGDIHFDVSRSFEWRFPDQTFQMVINIPHQVSFGARFWPHEILSLEVDAYYFSWSQYKERRVDLSEGVYEGPGVARTVDRTDLNMDDNFMVAIGAELDPIEHLVLRLGVGYDSCSAPESATDAIQPDSHRINIGTSIGTEWSGFYTDLAYMLTYMIPRTLSSTATMPGSFDTMKHALILSFGYHFGS
jgi:long-chain fatty acid transport protein